MTNTEVVCDSLEPDPIVDPVKTEVFSNEAGDNVIVGEVSVKSLAAGEDTFPQK